MQQRVHVCVCLCRSVPWQLHGVRPPGPGEEVPLSGYRSAQLHAVELVRSTNTPYTSTVRLWDKNAPWADLQNYGKAQSL